MAEDLEDLVKRLRQQKEALAFVRRARSGRHPIKVQAYINIENDKGGMDRNDVVAAIMHQLADTTMLSWLITIQERLEAQIQQLKEQIVESATLLAEGAE